MELKDRWSFFLSISFLPFHPSSSPSSPSSSPSPSHLTASDSNTTPPSQISQTHPYPAYIHFHPPNIFHPNTYIHKSNISFFAPIYICIYIFSFLFGFSVYTKKTYKMTSKFQRKIWSVSKTAASAAVEGALDAILYRRKKKGQFVFLFGDARIRIRIREDVQTMPGLEGRGGAAAAAGGGRGREMGDGERISLLVILFFSVRLRN